MDRLRDRFYRRAAASGIHGDLANKIFLQVQSFSGYGVPQSHALAFAHLVFVSAWLKRHHPAAFCAALLRTQPMAFYTPQSLVADARRHGVNIRRAQVGTSLAHAGLEPDPTSTGGHAIRLGLAGIRTLGDDLATRIADHRRRYGPYESLDDLSRRTNLTTLQLEALATAGALAELEADRRAALWKAGAAAREHPATLPGTAGITAKGQGYRGCSGCRTST